MVGRMNEFGSRLFFVMLKTDYKEQNLKMLMLDLFIV